MNELAAQVGVSRATAYTRVERLRRERVITGFTATIDPARAGFGVTALILLNVRQADWQAARDLLLAVPGVVYLAMTSGAFDMVMLVRAADVHHLRDVVLGEAPRGAPGPHHPDRLRAGGARAAAAPADPGAVSALSARTMVGAELLRHPRPSRITHLPVACTPRRLIRGCRRGRATCGASPARARWPGRSPRRP